MKSWLIGKDSDTGRDWGQEKKGTTEDEMAEWHQWLNGCESEWTLGVVDGQGGLVCCDSWGRKELDTTEWLNWTDRLLYKKFLLTMIKIRKPKVQQRHQGNKELGMVQKVRRQSISQERGWWLSSFVLRRMFTEGNPPTCFISLPQSWDFFGRNDAKAETPVLWPPHAKSWLIGKDSDTGRD